MYLLNAIRLTPGGSSTVHIYTQTKYRTTQLTTWVGRLSAIRTQSGETDWEKCRPRAPSLRIIPWNLPYTWGKSTGKPQSG